MTSISTPYPGFEYQEFHHRRQQQSSVLLTPSIFSWYQQLLQKHRVYFDAERASWLILGYEEVLHILSDPLTFSSQRELDPDGNNHPIDGLISLDPPRHRQVRALISKAFTPRRVARLEGRITSLVHTLLETVAEKREMDIVDDLALPLPSRVMADLLGCPPADADRFQLWLAAVMGPDLARAALAQVNHTLRAVFARAVLSERNPRDRDPSQEDRGFRGEVPLSCIRRAER